MGKEEEERPDPEQPLREALRERAEGEGDGQKVRQAGDKFIEHEEQALRRVLLPKKVDDLKRMPAQSGLMVPRRGRGQSIHDARAALQLNSEPETQAEH